MKMTGASFPTQGWCNTSRELGEVGTEVVARRAGCTLGRRFLSAAGGEGAGTSPSSNTSEGRKYGEDEDQNSLEKFLSGRARGQLNPAGEVRSRVKRQEEHLACTCTESYLGHNSWREVRALLGNGHAGAREALDRHAKDRDLYWHFKEEDGCDINLDLITC